MNGKQHTLLQPADISGKGLHSGADVRIDFSPAAENSGITFVRTDLDGSPTVEATLSHVSDTLRGTTLTKGKASVSTVEHVLAALTASGIDNAVVRINGPECPIMDGSSKPFMDLFKEAGISPQSAERDYFEPQQPITFHDPASNAEYMVVPSKDTKFTVLIDYRSKVLVPQHASIGSLEEFEKEIGPCRTFCFLHELEYMLEKDLIKGGSMDNAVVFVEDIPTTDHLKKLSAIFNMADVQVNREGTLNNASLRFPNEPARHKLLDVIGDLTLLGLRVKGHIIAQRPGHAGNVAFGKYLEAIIKKEKRNQAPKVDFSTAVYGIEEIMARLPHRPPFLFVDRILELSETHVVGMKNVTMNEPFFVGHFPGAPVMPGVLQIEAMAQVGGILVMNTVPDPSEYLTYFLKIDGVKFRKMVRPGDTLIFKLTLLSPIRRGLCHMKGLAFVGDDVVMEAEMMAQISKREQK